ncbi:MAG: ligand-gated channel [Desulfuromonadales bacterium GWC2_61_20]|nr:MAG: ligand-gated channel [Desulfuromonadales bacterium GWC2_61_20]
MRFSGLFLGLGLLLCVLPARAAEPLLLEEITVRGSGESPRDESLNIREVRESSARDVGEALQQIEGLSSVRRGAIANDPVLRGLQRDNINVLIDGARLHGACPSRMDPPSFHYDFAEVEQIRIVKGPYDLGNPGSMGGLIDVTTKKPDPGFGGDLNLTYGSWESIGAAATAAYGGKLWDGLLGYAYKYSDVPESGDGKKLTDVYPAASPNRYRPENIDSRAYEINTGWVKLGFAPSEKSRSELGYSYQEAQHVLYPYLKMDADYDKAQRLNWTWRTEKLPGVVEEVLVQAYWDRVEHLMDDTLRASSLPSGVVTRPYSMQTDATTEVYGAKLNLVTPVGSQGRWRNGIDFYARNWDAVNRRAMYVPLDPYRPLAMVPDVTTANSGIFSEYEQALSERLRLSGGARFDYASIDPNAVNTATASNPDRTFSTVGANLQTTWQATETVAIFAGLARGSRLPDAQELYIDVPATAPAVTWRGNPNLQAPVNRQADLGIKYNSDGHYLSGSVFYSSVENFINFYNASPTMKSYQNIEATLWGGELGGQLALPADLFLRGSLAYTRGYNADGHRPLAEMPPLKGTLALRYDSGAVFVEVAETMASSQERVDSALNEEATPGWATTDLKAGWRYRDLSLQAGVNNLFDKLYYNHLSYARDPFVSGVGVRVPETGRYAYVTVGYNF